MVASSALQVERLLRELLDGSSAEDITRLALPQLASRAVQLGLIDAKLADSINGLSVMRILAAMDQDRLTEHQALEFATLAAAIETLLSPGYPGNQAFCPDVSDVGQRGRSQP